MRKTVALSVLVVALCQAGQHTKDCYDCMLLSCQATRAQMASIERAIFIAESVAAGATLACTYAPSLGGAIGCGVSTGEGAMVLVLKAQLMQLQSKLSYLGCF